MSASTHQESSTSSKETSASKGGAVPFSLVYIMSTILLYLVLGVKYFSFWPWWINSHLVVFEHMCSSCLVRSMHTCVCLYCQLSCHGSVHMHVESIYFIIL